MANNKTLNGTQTAKWEKSQQASRKIEITGFNSIIHKSFHKNSMDRDETKQQNLE